MAVKILIPLDDSDGARRAVDYCARTFAGLPDLEVKLLHILSGLPPSLWDDGHILKGPEKDSRRSLIESWKAEQEKRWVDIFARAKDRLVGAGARPEAVVSEFKPKYFNVAEDILKTAAAGGYDTIVIGRRGLTGAKKVLLGSISSKVAHYAKDCAVIIVD